jgi:hypothetical protein
MFGPFTSSSSSTPNFTDEYQCQCLSNSYCGGCVGAGGCKWSKHDDQCVTSEFRNSWWSSGFVSNEYNCPEEIEKRNRESHNTMVIVLSVILPVIFIIIVISIIACCTGCCKSSPRTYVSAPAAQPVVVYAPQQQQQPAYQQPQRQQQSYHRPQPVNAIVV